MHEFSEFTKRILDGCTWLMFAAAAITLDQVAATITIVSGLLGAACGALRLYESFERRRAKRGQ